jgi:hypothetical protein
MNTNQSTINDGGRAFPTQNGCRYDEGMSLRDYFAAAALQGILASGAHGAAWMRSLPHGQTMGTFAYRAADEMLAARDGKEKL